MHSRLNKELQKVERQRELRASARKKGGAATALKNNKPHPAFAAAKLVAEPQHLPEPYKKEGNLNLAGDQKEPNVTLDRIKDQDLFEACEAIAGKVKLYLQRFPFDANVVAEAKAKMNRHSAAA